MNLTREEVKFIAGLARLELSEDEMQRYRNQLSQILAYFQQLEQLDTEEIQPTTSFLFEKPPLRHDQPQPGLTTDELLKNAPETDERLFRVPPIFE